MADPKKPTAKSAAQKGTGLAVVNKGEVYANSLASLPEKVLSTTLSKKTVTDVERHNKVAGRKSIVIAAIGRSGSGKTTKLIEIVMAALAAGRRVLIIDPDGGEPAWDVFKRYQDISQVPANFKGAVVVPFSGDVYLGTPTFRHIEEMTATTFHGGNNGPWEKMLVVIDDANAVMPDGRVEKPLMWLFARRRQYGFDIIITGHSWMRIPPFMFGYVNAFLIGPTLETPHPRSKFFSKQGLKNTEEARQYVNRYKEEFPDKYDGFLLLTIEATPFKGVI